MPPAFGAFRARSRRFWFFQATDHQERSSQTVWVWPIVLKRSGEEVGRLAVDRKPTHAHPRPSSNEAPSIPSRDHTLRHARRVRPPSKVNRKFAGTSLVRITCRHAPLFVRLWTTQSTPNEWPIKKILASFSTRVRRALRLSSMISHCLPRSLTVVICPSVHSCLCSFY